MFSPFTANGIRPESATLPVVTFWVVVTAGDVIHGDRVYRDQSACSAPPLRTWCFSRRKTQVPAWFALIVHGWAQRYVALFYNKMKVMTG